MVDSGPFSESFILNTHFAICWNGLRNHFCNHCSTHIISGIFFLSRCSKKEECKTQSAGNQRLTLARSKSSLVGTSETTRETIHSYPLPFSQWLAGLIDGDGSLQVSQKGYTSLEITVSTEDISMLKYIQDKLGGSIKLRAGAKAYRYRIHSKKEIITLLSCINGFIRHSGRLAQLHRVCQVLEIPVIDAQVPTAKSSWFAGFFDADGTIGISMKNDLPQLSIRVTSKLIQDVLPYKTAFNGEVYYDSSQNGYYQWSVQSKVDSLRILAYFKSSHFKSHKSKRFFLLNEYYDLYEMKAFRTNNENHKAWQVFMEKWNKLMIESNLWYYAYFITIYRFG